MNTLKKTKIYITLNKNEKEILERAIEVLRNLSEKEDEIYKENEDAKVFLTDTPCSLIEELGNLTEEVWLGDDDDEEDLDEFYANDEDEDDEE